jgi:hypothetical protein
MKKIVFTDTEISYFIEMLSKYYLFEEIRKVIRILSTHLEEETDGK